MASITFHKITSKAAYFDLVRSTLSKVEEKGGVPSALPYIDDITNGNVTIGIGFNLAEPFVRNAVLAQLGVTPSDPRFKPLRQILSKLRRAARRATSATDTRAMDGCSAMWTSNSMRRLPAEMREYVVVTRQGTYSHYFQTAEAQCTT